jgi:hypothetical protein
VRGRGGGVMVRGGEGERERVEIRGREEGFQS